MHIICMMGLGTHTNSVHLGGQMINPLGQQRRREKQMHMCMACTTVKKQAKV